MSERVIKDLSLLESILSEPEFVENDILYRKARREGREEGRAEGVHQGEEQALREAITDVLAERFGPVPESFQGRLATIHARADLKRLVAAAARAADLAAFRHDLESTCGGVG